MKAVFKLFSLFFIAGLAAIVGDAQAATIYESGTLGPTGIPYDDIADETVRATNVSSNVFVGARFFLDQPAITSQVGGHFIKNPGADDSFFGAIIALDNATDFPDSEDLATADVVGSTLLEFPEQSGEVFGDLNAQLDPGWYAVVFGSGLFGATGAGPAPRNNPDIGSPDYIGFVSSRWRSLQGTSIPFVDHRFVVDGMVIPEPSSAVLLITASLASAGRTACLPSSEFRNR